MEKQNITIYDVANKAGVSMATVSRVINNSSCVREDTKAKVLKIINDLNYRPNVVAKGLASKRTTTVGVITPDLINSYFSELAKGIDDVSLMYNYNIILASSDKDEKKTIKVINNLLAKQIDGLILIGDQLSDNASSLLKSSKVPVVLAGALDDYFPTVNIDYEKAVYEVIVRFIKENRKKIAFVGNLDNYIDKKLRLNGYKKALNENNIKFDNQLVFDSYYESYDFGYETSKKIKELDLDAVYAANDDVAVGILNGLLDLGKSVPSDIAIVTSNNTKITNMIRPKLGSIIQPLYDLGAVSMRLLTKLIDNETFDEKNVVLPHNFKSRQTG